MLRPAAESVYQAHFSIDVTQKQEGIKIKYLLKTPKMRSEHPIAARTQKTARRQNTSYEALYCCTTAVLCGAAFGGGRLYTRHFNMGPAVYRASSLPLHVMVTVLQFALPEIMSQG